jgi:putative toxin-antitoxin system antitoxin component (TIGR02293 family)
MSDRLRPIENLIPAATLALLGGPRMFDLSAGPGKDASGERGSAPRLFRLKYAAVEHLGRVLGESAAKLMRIIESNERTAQRRREQGMLNPEESDRIARIARVTQRAIEAFGDRSQAREWIKRPNRALQGLTPLGLLSTDAGAALVTDELGRIEYGDLY